MALLPETGCGAPVGNASSMLICWVPRYQAARAQSSAHRPAGGGCEPSSTSAISKATVPLDDPALIELVLTESLLRTTWIWVADVGRPSWSTPYGFHDPFLIALFASRGPHRAPRRTEDPRLDLAGSRIPTDKHSARGRLLALDVNLVSPDQKLLLSKAQRTLEWALTFPLSSTSITNHPLELFESFVA